MRKSKSTEKSGPSMCEWNDHGLACGHRGILSPGTAGGPWYCREHFYKLRGYHDADNFRGNDLRGSETKTSSFAVDEMIKKIAAKQRVREPGED